MAGKARIWTMETVRQRCDIDPTDPDSCWLWQCYAPKDRPAATVNGKNVSMARWVIELRDGVPPGRRPVIHACGNRRCLNPTHLQISTFGAVLRRAYKEGLRNKRKEALAKRAAAQRTGMAKMTIEQARAIRSQFLAGVSRKELKAAHEIDASRLSRILLGQEWQEFDPVSSVFNWGGK